MLTVEGLASAVDAAVARNACVPLLVFRLPEFEQIAWRDGKKRARLLERRTAAAFRHAAKCIVRDDDALAHDTGSDRFFVAMLAPARAGRPPGSTEVRAALERIAAAMTLSTGRRLETGWWPIESRAETRALPRTIEDALERGARERERGDMLATVGHELRTPLTSIRGYIETLLDGEVDPPTTKRFLQTARREALRLGRLIEGMLEFSLLDLSAHQRGARCDVVEQIRAAVESILPLARARCMSIRVDVPSQAHARVDGDACMHVLLNLLENAAKYGRDGGCIAISCTFDDPFICVAVDDDGPGIAPGERAGIFGLGIRGTAASCPGSGIGLAVVKAICERAGGAARVDASSLGGARFALRFPAG